MTSFEIFYDLVRLGLECHEVRMPRVWKMRILARVNDIDPNVLMHRTPEALATMAYDFIEFQMEWEGAKVGNDIATPEWLRWKTK